jgi:hypothetical protein
MHIIAGDLLIAKDGKSGLQILSHSVVALIQVKGPMFGNEKNKI